MKNVLAWAEIPATDLDRATRFYEALFQLQLIPVDTDEYKTRMFPVDEPGVHVSAAVIHAPGFYQPSSTDGVLVYLNGDPDLQQILDRVESAGGQVVMPKTQISPDYGYMALILDTEGNRIGLHSNG